MNIHTMYIHKISYVYSKMYIHEMYMTYILGIWNLLHEMNIHTLYIHKISYA